LASETRRVARKASVHPHQGSDCRLAKVLALHPHRATAFTDVKGNGEQAIGRLAVAQGAVVVHGGHLNFRRSVGADFSQDYSPASHRG
jgi:hypothetical protein